MPLNASHAVVIAPLCSARLRSSRVAPRSPLLRCLCCCERDSLLTHSLAPAVFLWSSVRLHSAHWHSFTSSLTNNAHVTTFPAEFRRTTDRERIFSCPWCFSDLRNLDFSRQVLDSPCHRVPGVLFQSDSLFCYVSLEFLDCRWSLAENENFCASKHF